jgi:hypothetical protein
MAFVFEVPKSVVRSTRRILLLAIPSILAVAGIGSFLSPHTALAQQANEKTFASPGEAVLALYDAAKTNNDAEISQLFGSNAQSISRTGDDVADRKMAAEFVTRYDQMHRVVQEPDGTVTLYVGAENWPLPIPITKNSSGTWYFDTTAGKTEILQRRVGTNENDAIEILYGLVGAQKDYASDARDGGATKQFAQKFLSDDGKQNGLYWKTNDNDPPSPIGPLLVEAASQGYTSTQQGKASPFHGYYFRILTKQGAGAKGGTLDYIVDGKMTRGFAFVAYPAQYRNSGVMTFIVDKDGVVYEKDLGAQTEQLAAAMDSYNPDNTWDRVD